MKVVCSRVAAIRYQAQLEEHLGDVGLLDLLGQHAFGAERTRLAEVQVAFLRGVHEDGNGRGARIVLDRLHGLEAVHARHHVIHEDHVGPIAGEVFDGGFGGFGGVHRDFVTLENARQKRACGLRIVHDQGSLGRHQLSSRRTHRQIYGKSSVIGRDVRTFLRAPHKTVKFFGSCVRMGGHDGKARGLCDSSAQMMHLPAMQRALHSGDSTHTRARRCRHADETFDSHPPGNRWAGSGALAQATPTRGAV